MKYEELKEYHKITFVYLLLAIVFVITLVYAIMTLTGYRFNVNQRKIEEFGLLQIRSIPDNATVLVDGKKMSFLDGGRANLTAGKHLVKLEKPGYYNWQKEIDIKTLMAQWLHVRLFPKKIESKDHFEFDNDIKTILSPSGSSLLVQSAKNYFEIFDMNNLNNKPKILDLNQSIVPIGDYQILKWLENRKQLIIQNIDTKKIFLIYTSQSHPPIMLSNLLPDDESIKSVIDHENKILMRGMQKTFLIDLNNLTQKAFLLSDNTVSALLSNDKVFILEKNNDYQILKKYKINEEREIILNKFKLDQKVQFMVTEYLEKDYIGLLVDQNFKLIKGSFDKIDGNKNFIDTLIKNKQVKVIFSKKVAKVYEMSFSPSGRYLAILSNNTKKNLVIFDLENKVSNEIKYKALSDGQKVNWFSDHNLLQSQNDNDNDPSSEKGILITDIDGKNPFLLKINYDENQAWSCSKDCKRFFYFENNKNKLILKSVNLLTI